MSAEVTEADPTDQYRLAGLTEPEITAVSAVAAEVGGADSFAAYVAVPLGAVRLVLAVLDRLTAPKEAR